MALGKKNGRIEGKAFSLKLKLKEGTTFLETPYFEIQEKQGDKYVVTGKESDVSGDLIKVETRVNEYEGAPIRSFKVALRDSQTNEIYFTEFGLGSSVGRGVANSVLNLTDFADVQFGCYVTKNKETQKKYPAVSVRQGNSDKTTGWKFNPKDEGSEMPSVREFAGKGGKTEKDWTAVEEFFLAKLNAFAGVVDAAKAKPASGPAPTDTQASNKDDDSNDNDVPF